MRYLSALSLSILLLFSFGVVASAAQLPDDASDQEITDAGYLTDDEIAEAAGMVPINACTASNIKSSPP